MKSPANEILVALYALCQCAISISRGEETLLWTQTSSLWSSINGFRVDLTSADLTLNGAQRVRSESQKHANKIGLGYDPVSDLVCWSDDRLRGVYCQARADLLNLTFVSLRTIVEGALDVRDIAIDWETGNIYLAAGRSVIVAPSRSQSANIYQHLIWEGCESVSGIAVDTGANKLFWSDSKQKRIEGSTLLGSRRQVLSSQEGIPIGITLNSAEKTIYWADSTNNFIRRCDYTGKNHKYYELSQPKSGGLYGITIASRVAFVTDTKELTVSVYKVAEEQIDFEATREIDAIPHQITLITKKMNQSEHECLSKRCSDMCLNEGDSKGRCGCRVGFWLAADGVTCLAKSELNIILTTGSKVILTKVSFNKTFPFEMNFTVNNLRQDGYNYRPLGFHVAGKRLFFGDSSTEVMFSGDPLAAAPVFTEHTVNTDIRGIAVDWLAGNVYWTDKRNGRIMMSLSTGRYHRLLTSDAGQPELLAVDSTERYLFWFDATEAKLTMWRSRLDGSEKTAISRDSLLGRLKGIFVDPHKHRLYWVKQPSTIACIDYDGNICPEILSQMPGEKYRDAVIVQEVIALADNITGLQFRSTVNGGKYVTENNKRVSDYSYEIVAYDRYLQPHKDHPCQNNNGGCDQLCILSGADERRCACAIGFKLNSNGRTCDSNATDEHFVLFTDPYQKQIYQLILNDTSQPVQGVSGPLMDHPITVDYDTGKQRYFWFDQSRGEFRRSAGTSAERVRKIGKGSEPQRLVVDPVSGWLYYTDRGRKTLSRMRLDGSSHEDLFVELDRPFDVALDYENQVLVWSTANSIQVAFTNKTGMRTIEGNMDQAGGVAILAGKDIIYFSDNKTGTIYSYNLTDDTKVQVYHDSYYKIHALTVTEDHLYFTAYNDKAVYWMGRMNGNNAANILGDSVFARITDIKTIRNKVEPKYREGFNWIILAAVLGAILLLFLLLAIILAVRKARRNPKTETETETGFDNAPSGGANDVDQTYTYMNQSQLYDLRGHNEAMNDNSTVANGSAANGSTGFDAVVTGVTKPWPDLISDGRNIGEIPAVAIAPAATGAATGAGVATTGAASRTYTQEEIDAIYQRYKPKKDKKKTMPRDPEFVFAGDKVATRIQRLANRLRNRLSSVRWSSGDKGDGEETTQPAPADGQDAETVDPNRGRTLPTATKVSGPPIRYEMPRGYAPASHSKPQHIKGK